MKVCVLQPYYSEKEEDMQSCYDGMISLMEQCDESLDLIVLPEYCDIPANTSGHDGFYAAVRKYNSDIARRASELAKRCHAMVFANFACETETGFRNTTYAFDREGNETGRYFKAHPAPSEVKTASQGGNEMDCSYSYEYREPYSLEMEGIRFCFMTCYDFYMYESFAAVARLRPDIVIGCSHQRTDLHNTLDFTGKFLSYNTGAWLIRSAVSMGKDSPTCGCSMIVSPKGEMLLNMKNDVGLGICEIDPKYKYVKPAGYKGKPKTHPEYIEEGRRPWLYRNAGSMMLPPDSLLPYPRVCAHRGFSTIAPENSLPAFGAAVALGAEEIEFDLWSTKDGELVSIHDSTLDRVSNGHGNVWDYTLEELQKLDFSGEHGEHFKGLSIVRFEDILKKFSGTVIMNIHVKIWDMEMPDPMYESIAALIRKYDCEKHCYMMTTSDRALAEFHEIAPEICRCVGFDGDTNDLMKMPRRAIRLGCEKVQLFKPYFNQETVDYAKANGILTNVFWSDDPDEAVRFLNMGIDTILSNDYLRVALAVKDYVNEKR